MLQNKKLIPIVFLFFSVATLSYAAEIKQVPTDIQSEQMVYNTENNTVTFTGKVRVVRPDFTLESKTLTVYLKEKPDSYANSSSNLGTSSLTHSRGGELDKIIAEGDVVLQSDNNKGHSQKATYFAAENKFIMEGNPVLTDKENTIRGEVVTHYLNTNKSEVSGKVQAVFFTPEKDEQNKLRRKKGK